MVIRARQHRQAASRGASTPPPKAARVGGSAGVGGSAASLAGQEGPSAIRIAIDVLREEIERLRGENAALRVRENDLVARLVALVNPAAAAAMARASGASSSPVASPAAQQAREQAIAEHGATSHHPRRRLTRLPTRADGFRPLRPDPDDHWDGPDEPEVAPSPEAETPPVAPNADGLDSGHRPSALTDKLAGKPGA